LPHTYTLPPDDGLLRPKTCRGILVQETKEKPVHQVGYYAHIS
jgi:hypothetical protein